MATRSASANLCWMFFLKIIDDQDQELELTAATTTARRSRRNTNGAAGRRTPRASPARNCSTFVNDELFPALKDLQLVGQAGRPPPRRARRVRGRLQLHEIRPADAAGGQQDQRRRFQQPRRAPAFRRHLRADPQRPASAGNAGEYYTPRAVTAFMADRIDPKPGEILLDPACGTGGFLTCAIRHMRERYVKRPEDERRCRPRLRAVEKKQLPHMLCVTNMLLHGIEDPSFVRHDNTLARPYISYTQADRVDIVLTNPPFGGREEDGIESNFPTHFRTRETADLFLALIIRLLKPGGRAAVVLPDGTLFGEGVKTRLKEHLMEECNLHTIVRLPNSRVQALCLDRHQPAVLREGRADQGHLVLRAPRARGPESLFDDQADPLRASARLHRLVGRREAQRPRGEAAVPGR